MVTLGEFIGVLISGLALPLLWLTVSYAIPPLRRNVKLNYNIATVLSCMPLALIVIGSLKPEAPNVLAALACPCLLLLQRKRAIAATVESTENIEQPELSIETLAMTPICFMTEDLPPFSDWKSPETDVKQYHEESFKTCVSIYQLYAFYILTAGRWGNEIAEKILSIQKERLHKAMPDVAKQFEIGIEQIHDSVSRNMNEPMVMEVDGESTTLPLEYPLALEFLTMHPDSLFHRTEKQIEEEGMPDYKDADWALTFCLIHGKEVALECFEHILENTKVVL